MTCEPYVRRVNNSSTFRRRIRNSSSRPAACSRGVGIGGMKASSMAWLMDPFTRAL